MNLQPKIKEALGNSEPTLIYQQAHTLNGASANVGALVLQKIAYQIEVAGKSGNLNKAGSLIPKIDEQFEMLKKFALKDQVA